ncbi:DnaB-like helicase C-terminal domain-containing protein [Pseudomonas helleri]|uniref:DnaB-like helicase C-terminal domain-containing protein n=1 Tax=Pseudomonas helleri TaxID=1608996 RepID=UPI00242AEC4E|nr:DnaB-like helicase C-terminal domain-containing protein [Pseudomonas helleri]
MSRFIGHYECNECGSSDALALYENDDDYSATCFNAACGKSFSNNQLAASSLGQELGIEVIQRSNSKVKPLNKTTPAKSLKPKTRVAAISMEEAQEIKELGAFDQTRHRALGKPVNEGYGVITHYKDKVPFKRFYPITDQGLLTGYKVRIIEGKKFYAVGRNDNQSEMFGQSLFPNGGYRLVIVGGEEDAMATYQMLRQNQFDTGKMKYDPTPVVSPTTGEGSAATQVALNFEWVDKFKEIIVIMDNDEAGKIATDKLLEVLPMGKVKVVSLPKGCKDPNQMLQDGLHEKFISSYWAAKKHNPAGIMGSGSLIERIIERAMLVKVPLPPFASELQKAMAGGIPLGYVVNIVSASGQGKTTLVNEFVHYWIFNSPYRVGIVSLEADPGEYGELLLSRHAGVKMALLETVEEKLDFLHQQHISEQMHELFFNEDGTDRFDLLDHQGSVGEDELKKKIEYLVKGLGCKLIIIDPLTLAMAGKSNDEMDEFTAWEKNFVSAHQCIIINVLHVRKNSNGQKANSRGGDISEEDIKGSGSIFQIAGANILLMRDKENADPVIRNTTKTMLSKNRWAGNTGPSGLWFYENQTHRLFDSASYWAEKNAEFEIPLDAYDNDEAYLMNQIAAHDAANPY